MFTPKTSWCVLALTAAVLKAYRLTIRPAFGGMSRFSGCYLFFDFTLCPVPLFQVLIFLFFTVFSALLADSPVLAGSPVLAQGRGVQVHIWDLKVLAKRVRRENVIILSRCLETTSSIRYD